MSGRQRMRNIPIGSGVPLLCWIVIALVATSCAASGDPEASGASDAASPSLPGGGLRSQKPSAPSSIATTLTGTLGFEEIEGGCAYLEADDGTRHQVIYPDGWELQRSPVQLVSPDGETVAHLGDTVSVRGMPASDMATTCQIGPIFRATEVLGP